MIVRPITEDEYEPWARATESPFFDELNPERLARWRRITEFARTLAVFDDDRIVGGSMLLRMTVSVPGGELAMGGLTAVGILPTHRRRGLLTQLMTRHLEDLREWGEPLSGLFAAEHPIYGRYGYGSAAPEMNWTLGQRHTGFRPEVAVEDGVRIVEADEALKTFPAIYGAARRQRPGMPDRSAANWQNWVGEDPPEHRDGMSRKYFAQFGDRGYAIYRATSGDWQHGLTSGRMEIYEHVAVDTAAAATLWRYLFDHDLMTSWKVMHRPVDDVLPLLMTNPRGLVGWQYDGMWLRPIDIAAVLGGRRYAVEGDLTIGVVDDLLPDNTANWRLDGGPEGAQCSRTTSEPDLRLEVGDLGAAYLGNLKVGRLVRAGRAEELTAGAAARADAIFATDPAPWCPQEF